MLQDKPSYFLDLSIMQLYFLQYARKMIMVSTSRKNGKRTASVTNEAKFRQYTAKYLRVGAREEHVLCFLLFTWTLHWILPTPFVNGCEQSADTPLPHVSSQNVPDAPKGLFLATQNRAVILVIARKRYLLNRSIKQKKNLIDDIVVAFRVSLVRCEAFKLPGSGTSNRTTRK